MLHEASHPQKPVVSVQFTPKQFALGTGVDFMDYGRWYSHAGCPAVTERAMQNT